MLPDIKSLLSSVKGDGGALSVWLMCQRHFSGSCLLHTPPHQGAASSLHGSGLLSREPAHSPLDFDAPSLAESAARNTVFGLALVFCRRWSSLLKAQRKHFWRSLVFNDKRKKKCPTFLKTLICFKLVLNFKKTFWVQNKNVAIALLSLNPSFSRI